MKLNGKEVAGVIHSFGRGKCESSGKQAAGMTVTMANGLVDRKFLSFAAFKNLVHILGGANADSKGDSGSAGPESSKDVSTAASGKD